MSERSFVKEFDVHYYEVNRHKEAEPVTILNYLEETAISHSYQVGLGIDKLMAEGVVWVLNRWMVNVERYPMYGQKVSVETWPSGFDRFIANREFLVRNENNEIIARASSVWLLINFDKRRPTRIPQEFGELYGINNKKVCTFASDDEKIPEGAYIEKELAIMRSDIDTNGHVNNKKYMGWLLETLPEEVYLNYSLSTFDVKYKKEINSGCVICRAYPANPGQDEELGYMHKIIDRGSGTILAEAVTKWRKNLTGKTM
jgi:acyl-ACP thioesterase